MLLLIAAAMSIGGVIGAASPSQSEVVDLSYSVRAVVTLREPVILEIAISNSSAEEVTVDLGRNSLGAFHLRLVDPAGKRSEADPGAVTGAGGGAASGRTVIAPKQRHTQSIVLNQWLPFDRAGVYDLTIGFTDAAVGNPRPRTPDHQEGSVTIAILPPDDDALRTACASWLQALQQARNATDALFAARALAVVKDPIAAPYLGDAIRSRIFVAPIVIDALEKIGGPKAEAALDGATHDRRSDIAEMARAALQRLRAKSRN